MKSSGIPMEPPLMVVLDWLLIVSKLFIFKIIEIIQT